MSPNSVILGKTDPASALPLESYPLFIPNQALASSDLNQLTQYLKTQGQLTRNSLLGVGILKGLLVSHSFTEGSGTATQILLSEGACVTPDGYYVTFKEKVALTHYQALKEPPFSDLTTPVELFVDSPRNDRIPLSQTFGNSDRTEDQFTTFLSNKILLLVVELVEETRTALLSYDTVTQGHNLVARFLLCPFPSEEELTDKEFLKKHGFLVLKQQQAIQKLLLRQTPYLPLKRFGTEVDATESSGAKTVSINLTEFDTYNKVQQNYVTLCTEAIKTIVKPIQEVDDLINIFPLLTNAIKQNESSPPTDFSFANLSTTLTNQLEQQSQNDVLPNGLQYFYDYLSTIAMAYGELISSILALNDYLPDATEQRFLMLGNVLAADEAEKSPALAVTDRSHFVQSVTAQSTLRQIEQVAFLYQRLLQLCAEDSFKLSTTDEIGITLSCDRSAPLSQQAIPYYLNYEKFKNHWNYNAHYQGISETLSSYHNSQPASFLNQSPKEHVYRIEGHLGRSRVDALNEIKEFRDRYNLSFEIIPLKLNTEASTSSINDKYLFHNFAAAYPGMEHLGGVKDGGTFLLIYIEDPATETESIIADFALPYRVKPDVAQPPPTISIIDPETQEFLGPESLSFRNNDETEYLIRLTPEGGKAEGRGVIEKDDGQFYFQPSQLTDDINQQINVLLIGWWPHGIETQTLTVYAQPSAQFKLDKYVSGVDPQDAAMAITIKQESLPLVLTPEIPGGTFQVFNLENEVQENLIQGTPPIFTLPEGSELTDVKITYTLPAKTPWGEQSSTLQVHIEPTLLLSLTITPQSFQKDDVQEHPILLTPPGGTVMGRGVTQKKDDQGNDGFYFQPSLLKNDINEQINILLIGSWPDGISTKTVTVYSRSLAQFWMERQHSGPDAQGQDVVFAIEPTSPPLFLKPKIQEGDFSVYDTSDPEKTPLDNLINPESSLFIPQNIESLNSVTIEYTLNPEKFGTLISNSIIVQIQRPIPQPPESDEDAVPPDAVPPDIAPSDFSDRTFPDTTPPRPDTFPSASDGSSASGSLSDSLANAVNVPSGNSVANAPTANSDTPTVSNSAVPAPNTLIPEFFLQPISTTDSADDQQSTILPNKPNDPIPPSTAVSIAGSTTTDFSSIPSAASLSSHISRSTPVGLPSNDDTLKDTPSVSPNSAPMRKNNHGSTVISASPAPQPSLWRRMVQIMTAPIG